MAKYEVVGFSKFSGEKMTIIVEATSIKHAKIVAYDRLTYPHVMGKTK